MKFDVVVGNPPYQGENDFDTDLWPQIVNRSIEMVNQDGYLAMITPNSWLKSKPKRKGKISYTAFHDYQIKTVCLMDQSTAKSYFDVGSTFCWFIIKKAERTEKTRIINMVDGVVDYAFDFDLEFKVDIPAVCSRINMSIHEKVKNHPRVFSGKGLRDFEMASNRLKLNGLVSNDRSDEFPFKCYYSSSLFRYTKVKSSKFEMWKTMVGGTNELNTAFVDNNCSFCEDIKYVLHSSKDEAENCLKVLRSNFFIYLASIYRRGKNANFSMLPSVDLSRPWSDAELYDHFGLTEEEIRYIEETVK